MVATDAESFRDPARMGRPTTDVGFPDVRAARDMSVETAARPTSRICELLIDAAFPGRILTGQRAGFDGSRHAGCRAWKDPNSLAHAGHRVTLPPLVSTR